MWLRLAVVAFVLEVLPSAEGKHFRIIAGRRAHIEEFPYQVEVEKGGHHWCGGSIIHRKFVLTAAHCIKKYEWITPVPEHVMRVRVGNDYALTGGTVHEIEKLISHEEYSDEAVMDQFDIGLIKLREPLKLSDRVQIISLSMKTPREGQLGWVTGFGKQEQMRRSGRQHRHLMAVELPVVGLERCREALESEVTEDMICAGFTRGHRDACGGDSGGPYEVEGEQVGVVAWGIGCGREGLPGVYTNVAMYRQWVKRHLAVFGETL